MHDQFLLDFTSRANERCAKLLGLRSARLPVDMTRGRVEGVIELLQRLALLCRDLPEALTVPFAVDCQVMAIAARIERRKTVSEKTIRNWTADAKLLGLLDVDYASQQYGGSRWNTYTVHFGRVVELLSVTHSASPKPQAQQTTNPGGNGRKRPVTVSALGAVTTSAPNNVFTSVSDKYSPLTLARSEGEVVVSASDDVLEELQTQCVTLGMSSDGARGAVAKAIGRGLTHAQIGELVELYRKLEKSPDRDPHMTAGWLYRWLSGQSSPPKASGSAPKPPQTHCGGRGDGLSKQQVSREALRASIIRAARAAGASEDQIRERCQQAGVEY